MTPLPWISQGLLALIFLMAGMMKLLQSKPALVEKMPVLAPFSPATLKLIGTLEVLGAIGVIGPVLLGVMTGVVPWAAAGLALVMVGAAVAHARRGEWAVVGMNAVLFALAAYVAAQHAGGLSP